MSAPDLEHLRGALAALPAEAVATPQGGRLGGVLVLLRERDGDAEFTYTRRRDDLRTHPGQISFPGGAVDPGESVVQAALREAREEVGLDPATTTVLGLLPAFYIPPSRFWLQPVVASWDTPHPLVAAEAEVAEVLQVGIATLREQHRLRVVRIASAGWSWAWQLDDGHLLWGATALVTAVVLGLLDPDWAGGLDGAALPADREVRPWEAARVAAPRSGPALVPGLLEVPMTQMAVAGPGGDVDPPDTAAIARAGTAIGVAVQAMGLAPVLVLAGRGGNGAAGRAAARHLALAGVEVAVVGPDSVAEPLPDALLVVDALVGGGLRGRLTGPVRDLVLALRHRTATVLAVDLPTGIHPSLGLVGDFVPADVTLALGSVQPALLAPGMGPMVGDLVVADLGVDPPVLSRAVTRVVTA